MKLVIIYAAALTENFSVGSRSCYNEVKKLLSEMENGVSPSDSIDLQAMWKFDKAWNNVSSSTEINSFKKAGIIENPKSSQTINIDNPNKNCTQKMKEQIDRTCEGL